MGDINTEEFWDKKYEDKQNTKRSMKSKLLAVGVTAFSICAIINTVLIYTFLNTLSKISNL